MPERFNAPFTKIKLGLMDSLKPYNFVLPRNYYILKFLKLNYLSARSYQNSLKTETDQVIAFLNHQDLFHYLSRKSPDNEKPEA